MMLQKLEAVFDGTALQPEVPLNLAAGTRVRIIVESVVTNEGKSSKTFLETAQSLKLQGEPDWSEKVDQDLYIIHRWLPDKSSFIASPARD